MQSYGLKFNYGGTDNELTSFFWSTRPRMGPFHYKFPYDLFDVWNINMASEAKRFYPVIWWSFFESAMILRAYALKRTDCNGQ